MSIFKKLALVKCEECMCLLMAQDASIVHEREQNILGYPDIITKHYFCQTHKKNFDVIKTGRFSSSPTCYKIIPERMQLVDKKGKFI